MMRRLAVTGLLAALVMAVTAGVASAQTGAFPYARPEQAARPGVPVVAEQVSLTVRDGVVLAADLYRPAEGGPHPTLVIRTPYGRASGAESFGVREWAATGYAILVQDVRGKGDSGGAFDPWVDEAADGYDTIEWAAAQPWSNGRVGTVGGSYLGAVQWAAASLNPPSLKVMAVLPAISDPFFGGAYDHGVLALAPYWPFENGGKAPRPVPAHDEALLNTLPLSRVDEAVFGETAPLWDGYLVRERRSDWRAPHWPEAVCASSAPVLVFMALWDGDVAGPALNWQARNACGSPQDQLVFGPWGHNMNQNGRRGDVPYGDASRIGVGRVLKEFLDAHLKAAPTDRDDRARVFVTGENGWRALAQWPPAAEAGIRFDLTPGGELTPSDSETTTPASVIDTPLRFVAQPSGRTLAEAVFARSTLLLPPADAETQPAFLTAPFETVRVLGGSPRLTLTVVPDADDMDLFVFIVDVAPDGTMRVVNQPGKLRLSYRHGWDERVPLVPGDPVEIELRAMDFAHRFAPGHRLGVVLRSEWRPRWSANTGAGPIADAPLAENATHRLRFGPGMSSRLTLSELPPA